MVSVVIVEIGSASVIKFFSSKKLAESYATAQKGVNRRVKVIE